MQCSVVLLIIQIAPLVDNALAQSIERGQTGTPSYYRLAPGLDDMLTIDVNVWGEVSRPGRYTVPDYTDLLSLLSFAGGPTDDAKLDKIKIIRTLDGREEVIHIDLKRFLARPTQISYHPYCQRILLYFPIVLPRDGEEL